MTTPAGRLASFAAELERSLGDVASVERSTGVLGHAEVRMTPARPDALGVIWLEGVDEVIVETLSGPGGRWELGTANEDIELVEGIVRSIIAGRVSEVFGPGRSRVTVTLADGTSHSELGLTAPAGCLPLPFWTRWGRRVHYTPYRADDHR